ncbi:hypothetical protein D9615_001341 [Tricholomella constricta]|uniref:Proteasome activator PA28 C-terminal domain-containing protein n=1 Tax=Tricholomella constricta TaxID=117010 RepID=A0A8H5HKS7_9AGAR|nr:hypothetical protein D9615_001341 [Tricholomella constricta]
MDKDIANKVEVFRKAVTKAGEDIVFSRFPAKAESFTDTTVYPPQQDSVTNGPVHKKRKRDDNAQEVDRSAPTQTDLQYARIPSRIVANQHMSQKVHEVVKGESGELAAMIDQVKLWVTLTMPKIEDGDNFGVQIQEEVLAELHRAQESAYNLRDGARQDYLARAKICSKILKYPNIEDYTLALKEHDERQLYIARQHLLDLRNMYAVLTDLIHKNISKASRLAYQTLHYHRLCCQQIRAPKANNSVGLY